MKKKSSSSTVIIDESQDKTAKVEKECSRIMALFEGADENRMDFIRDAVRQVAWLGITILELQAEIDRNGAVVFYQNGQKQTGLQANPACKTLNDFQTLYNAQFRALLPVVPVANKRTEFIIDREGNPDG